MNVIYRKEVVNFIIILFFMMGIIAPILAMMPGFDKSALLTENRVRAHFPSVALEAGALRKFPHDFFCYFRDNFGLRDTLVKLNFVVKRKILRVSAFNDVVFGKEDWLFYQGEKEMDDSRGITRYDEATLRKWSDSLELKRKWLSSRGIKYVFVVVPGKGSVYGEYLPDNFGKVADETGLDQLVNYLKTNSALEVIDLRPVLLAAKKQERLYGKTDTHWNEYGAFIATREITRRISAWFPALPAASIDDYVVERKLESGGDLAIMLGAGESIKEEQLYLVPRLAMQARRVEFENAPPRSLAMQQDDTSLPRVLVFRDSFFDAVLPFFSEQFQYSRYYRQHWDESVPIDEIVKSCRPDIVVEEIAERRIKMDMGVFTLKQ